MPNFTIERATMAIAAFFMLATIIFFAGYSKGYKAKEAEYNKVVVTQINKNVVKQTENKIEVKQAGEDYEAKFKVLEDKFKQLGYDFGRLRVKRTGCSMSTVAANSATSIGASAEAESIDRPGTSEVNLDGVAAKVIELGTDLDKSNTRIEYLQDLLKSNHKACTVQ